MPPDTNPTNPQNPGGAPAPNTSLPTSDPTGTIQAATDALSNLIGPINDATKARDDAYTALQKILSDPGYFAGKESGQKAIYDAAAKSLDKLIQENQYWTTLKAQASQAVVPRPMTEKEAASLDSSNANNLANAAESQARAALIDAQIRALTSQDPADKKAVDQAKIALDKADAGLATANAASATADTAIKQMLLPYTISKTQAETGKTTAESGLATAQTGLAQANTAAAQANTAATTLKTQQDQQGALVTQINQLKDAIAKGTITPSDATNQLYDTMYGKNQAERDAQAAANSKAVFDQAAQGGWFVNPDQTYLPGAEPGGAYEKGFAKHGLPWTAPKLNPQPMPAFAQQVGLPTTPPGPNGQAFDATGNYQGSAAFMNGVGSVVDDRGQTAAQINAAYAPSPITQPATPGQASTGGSSVQQPKPEPTTGDVGSQPGKVEVHIYNAPGTGR